jgi:hypothetical protein
MRMAIYWSGVIRADSGTVAVYIGELLKVLQIGRERMALNSCSSTGRVDGSEAGCEDMDVSDVAGWIREMQCRADGDTFCTRSYSFL